MKLNFTIAYFILLLILCTFGCKKESSKADDQIYDVYLGGTYQNNAAYWKNGSLTKLSANYSFSSGQKIVVSGNNVYLSGYVAINDTTQHTGYWKNGAFTDCGIGNGGALAVNGNDVYLGGSFFTSSTTEAAIWKNGTVTDLGSGNILDIAIFGNDVYAVGYSEKPGSGPVATYWKNNVPYYLPSGEIVGIAISGTDIYAVGSLTNSSYQAFACYWKNWQLVKQFDSQYVTLNSISVSGNDVYVAGSINTIPQSGTYYKNGMPVSIAGATSLSGMAVVNNNVYLAGDYQTVNLQSIMDTWNALYIKNGVSTILGITQGSTPGIYVSSIALSPE